MKRIIKWSLVGLGSFLGLALLGLATVHIYMEQRLDRVHDFPGSIVEVPTDPASIAEGERLARLRGCMGGCHGRETEGSVFFKVPDGTRVVAPDLGRIAIEYTNVDLERAIRHGIKLDGTSVIGVMPSAMFHGMSDQDFGTILAFLATRSPGEAALPDTRIGPVLRAMLLYYSRQLDWDIFPGEAIDHEAEHPAVSSGDSVARGRYLATTVCTECHGDDLRGTPDGATPNLSIVAAYTRESFETLMRTGKPIGDRELGLMKTVSLSRFVHFTAYEVDDLYAFLQTLAATN